MTTHHGQLEECGVCGGFDAIKQVHCHEKCRVGTKKTLADDIVNYFVKCGAGGGG